MLAEARDDGVEISAQIGSYDWTCKALNIVVAAERDTFRWVVMRNLDVEFVKNLIDDGYVDFAFRH